MENLRKVFDADISAIKASSGTLRDIYNVMFSHKDHVAYEMLDNYEIKCATYGELEIRIEEFSGYINKECPEADNEYIGIDLPNSPDFLVAFWSVLQSGNKPYLLNSYYPIELNLRLLKKLGARIVITKAAGYSEFVVIEPGACNSVSLPARKATDWADEIAISSSLTGLEAKICVFDGKSIVNQILNATGIVKKNNWLMLSYDGKIKLIAVLPFFHIFGLIATYFWFAFFGRTIVFPQNHAPDTIRGTINRHQVTHVFAPPILFNKLYKSIMSSVSQETDKRKRRFGRTLKIAFALQNLFPCWGVCLSKKLFREIIGATFGKSVRFMISGGAFIGKDVLKLINNIGYPLFNGYGTTETSITSADFRKKIKHRISGSVGVPFESVEYSITDGRTLSISGRSICRRIVSFDAEQSDFSRIQTNDIVRMEKGQYYVEGRASDLFIGDSGENVSPEIIENGLTVRNANNYSVLELDGKLTLVLEYNEMLPDFIITKEVERLKRELAGTHFGLTVGDILITRDRIANENSVKASRALLRRKISEGEVRLARCSSESDLDVAGTHLLADDSDGISTVKELFFFFFETSADIDIHANFFIDLHGSSLDYFTLMSDIANVFNIQINLEKRNNLYTVYDVYKYLMELI
ncbi:MAG: AMP-binding protein [Oscillospiraceae bacterium]|jgi:acyl-CoA synthetase (AMP-forming)/AMP-acid ligase II/acyl carrier protein|nr:AMP-binding protein [Oscillospiraceae bacterium]